MRFSIKNAGPGSERICTLTGFVKSHNASCETPTNTLFTQGGSVVHLTADVLSRVFSTSKLLWVPLASTYHLETGVTAQGDGIAKFSGLSEHVACLTANNINQLAPVGHFEGESVPLWTKNGKKMITADRYMDIMEIFKPDLILAIADSNINLDESHKRITKSVERSRILLDKCVYRYKGSTILQNSALIGVIVGAGMTKKCEECIKNVLKHKDTLQGVLLSGLTNGSEESLNVPVEKIEPIFKSVGEAIPKDWLRIIEGCWNPAITLAAIDHGWDLFDGSYPLKLTNAGLALRLNLDISGDSDELCILDLAQERYKEEFKPILDGCTCLACRNHTRAYIRHLINTREMLASVLLSIHNLHHFDQMFAQARHHIASNSFSVYRKHITEQYYKYKETKIPEKTKIEVVNTNIENEKHNKRQCVSDTKQCVSDTKPIKTVVNGS